MGCRVGFWPGAMAFLAIAATNEILLASDGLAAAERSYPLEILTIGCVVLSLLLMVVLWKWRGWRPARLDGRTRPTPWRPSAMASGLAFVTCLFFAPILVEAGRSLRPENEPMLMGLGIDIWAGSVAGLLLAIPIGVLAINRPRPTDAAPRTAVGTIVPLGVLAFLLVFPFVQSMSFLGGLVYQLVSGESPDLLGHQTLQLLNESPRDVGWWLIVVGVVVIVPWQEEVVFRGMLQQTFRKAGWDAAPAIVVTSSIFTLLHITAITSSSLFSIIPSLFVLSIGLGVLRERTGRTSVCVITHGVFNLVNVLLMLGIAPTG